MSKIKTILAFVALALCGGAWAAAPVALWTNFTGADADSGITSGGCTLKANGNTVAADGSTITIGSSGVVVSYGTAKPAYSVVVKYSSLNLTSSADQAIFTCQNGNNNNRLGFHMTANAAQLKGIADGADYGTAATTTLRASDTIAFTHKNDVGTYLYRKGDSSSVCGYVGLKYGSNTYNSTTIGGMTSSTTFAVAEGMVIEAVAVFDTNLSAADFNTFTFEKEMLYCFPLDGNKDNVGGIGNLTLTKGGSTDEANFWNDGGALSSDKCYKNNSANQGYILGDGSSPITSFAQGWTLSWWVKPNDLQNWRDVCGFHIGATGYKIEKTDANKLQVYNNSSIAALSTPISYTDNNAANWIHIAFVSNADGETVSVYGNGTYVCNLSPNGATKLWGNGAQGLTKVAIGLNGLYNINGGVCRNAMVDEVAIYNFSATAAQVAYLAKNKPAAALGASGDKFWTGAAGDGNWNTAGNWSMDRAPTAEDDVVIINPATITLANDSTAKSIGIEADVTFAGQIVDGNVNNVTIAHDKTLTINYANTGTEGGIRNVIGGTLVKTGAANLRLANANGSAVNGTTVRIDQGTVVVHNSGGGDAVMTDPTFVIGENGRLTNWGWFTANGTLTLESNYDKEVFDKAGSKDSAFKGTTKIVKKGTGNIKLMSWKANASNQKCAIDSAIEIQAGRLTFYPHGSGYTVNGAITGAGQLGVMAGSAADHSVIIGDGNTGTKNTFTGGTVVESGTLGLGHKNALGGQGKALRVESGAAIDVRGFVDHGTVATLNGGTIKNSGANCGTGSVQFRSIVLEADSTVDIAANVGILNNSYNATTMTLNGHKLTKKGNGTFFLTTVTSDAGTIRIEGGHIEQVRANNLAQVSVEVAASNAKIAGNYAFTLKDVTIENGASLLADGGALTVNGTLKLDGSIAKTTTVASTGTLDLSAVAGTSSAEKITGNLTINSGVAFKFPEGHTGDAYTLCGGTLTAPESYAGQVTVGEAEPFPATLVFNTEEKTVSYASALTEYELSATDVTAITDANLAYGHATLIDVSAEVDQDIAKEAAITGAPDGYAAYALGTKQIAVVRINYDVAMEAKLNEAALHFDASRLNTIAADSSNNVTGWDNLGSDATRPVATTAGNGRTANVSPTLGVQDQTVCIDFGDCNSQKDLGWSRMSVDTVIEVADIAHDARAFLFGDYNGGQNGSGDGRAYGFHRNGTLYFHSGNSRISAVWDNGVSKRPFADDCPAGMRVLTMTKNAQQLNADCFTMDRNNTDNRSGGRKLYEVLVFTAPLSDADRVAIEDYLLRKWFNAKAVVNGVPKTSIQEALDAAEGNYANVRTLVEPTEAEIPEGWIWQNGTYVQICARVDGVDYTSLADALAHVEGTTTITLLANIVAQGETIPSGVTIDLAGHALTGTLEVETGALITDNGVLKINGIATSFDITFNHKEDIGKSGSTDGTIDYAGVSGMHVRFDNAFKLVKPGEDGPIELAQDEAVTKETGAHLMNHPYVEGITGFYRNTDQLTFAVVGTMPKSMRTTFIHMGESRTANDGGYGLLIATGDVKDEVIVAWNKGTEIHELTRMSVPNAATTRHVYVITKDDDATADSSIFTVYLDGKKWKTIEQKPRFMIIGGLQVGSDFGGIIKDAYNSASEENKSKYFRQSAQADGGVINVIRAYDRIISAAEIEQYSVESEYPYHSPNGSSTRTFAEGTSNWVEETEVWSNTPAEGDASTGTAPLAGASVTATLEGETTIAVNVPAEGASYEALDIAGSGSAVFTSATDSGAIRVTGMVTLGRPITVEPGSLDLGTAPITLLEDGTLTFDYSSFDVSTIYTTTKINLTGDIAQDDDKVNFTAPTSLPYRTATMAYDNTIKQYVLTITPNHEDGADVYLNSAAYFDGSLDGKVDTTLDGTTKTAVFPNDTVVFAEGKALPQWVGKPQCAKIKIATDVTLGMGQTSDADHTAVAPALDGVTITVEANKMLTLNNQDRSWAFGSVTMNGPGAVLVKGSVTATAIAGDATLKLAEGATLTVDTALSAGRVVSSVADKVVKMTATASTTIYALESVEQAVEEIAPADESGLVISVADAKIYKNDSETATGSTTIPNETGRYTVKQGDVTVAEIGVIAVAPVAKATGATKATTPFAVPFKALDGSSVTVAKLLNTALLTAGDELHVLNGSTYQTWTLSEVEGVKKWTKATTVTAEGVSEADPAETTTVPVGSAAWVTTADQIVVYGQYGAKIAVKVGTGVNLLGNTSMTAATPTATEGDVVQIPGEDVTVSLPEEGAKDVEVRQYTMGKNDAWSREVTWKVTQTVGGQSMTVRKSGTDAVAPSVPAGRGYFLKRPAAQAQ